MINQTWIARLFWGVYTECLKKELTLLNILPNKKCETSSGNFHNSYVWMAERLIYHMTPTKILKYSCLGEHWPLLYRVWKLGCARIGCPFWLSEKSPSIEIADGLMNLWLITMDMGLCCVWRVPFLAPAPPNYIQPHPIPQHVLSAHSFTYSCRLFKKCFVEDYKLKFKMS